MRVKKKERKRNYGAEREKKRERREREKDRQREIESQPEMDKRWCKGEKLSNRKIMKSVEDYIKHVTYST